MTTTPLTEQEVQARLDRLFAQFNRGIITKQEFDAAVRKLNDQVTQEATG